MVTTTASADHWQDSISNTEVDNIQSLYLETMTIDVLKQLRYRTYSNGREVKFTPEGKNKIHLDYDEECRITYMNSPMYNREIEWNFDDENGILTFVRVKGQTPSMKYSDNDKRVTPLAEYVDIVVNGETKQVPISFDAWYGPVTVKHDQYGRPEELHHSDGITEFVYETESFSVYPEVGEASVKDKDRKEVLYVGDEFTFEAVTALCVDEISIEADGMYDDLSYEVLVDEYDLDWYDNGDGKTKTWTVTLPLYTAGDRTFKLITDGRDFDIEIEATVYEADFEIDDECTHDGEYRTETEIDHYLYDDNKHEIFERHTYICEECGEPFDEENESYIENHTFLNNYCTECGYEKKTQSFGPTPQQGDAAVTVNGSYVQFDVPPQIINGRTMIPLRAVTEALGAKVTWQPDWNAADILIAYDVPEQPGLRLEMELNIDDPWVMWYEVYDVIGLDNGEIHLDSPPVIVNDRTLVPIRAIAELMGYTVEWDDATKAAIIY